MSGRQRSLPLLADAAARDERRRFLALHLPRLPTDRLLRVEPPLRDGAASALATWTGRGGRRLLAAVDARAAAAGLRPDQTVADAQAILPDLALRPADPAGDGDALHRLALWARRYTPLAAADPPDGLLLDVTGCAHLSGGERGLLRDAAGRLRRAGFEVRAALAGAPGTAIALACGGSDGAVAAEGMPGVEVVSPLPLAAALRLPPEIAASLHRLGLRRVGDLLARPRGPLALRFGEALLDRLDEATGVRRRPMRPVRPLPDLSAARDFAEPVVTRRGIDAALDLLLADLCRALLGAGRGARRVALLAARADGAVQEAEVGTGLPTRDPAHLRRLFAERLERLAPGECGFERLALEARATDALPAGVQPGLPRSPAKDGDAEEESSLARLLDRLAQRLHVRRPLPRATHWPERAIALAGPFDAAAADARCHGRGSPPLFRPVRLLRRPVPLDGTGPFWRRLPAALPLGPGRGAGSGPDNRVRAAEGPERFEPEWWRDRPGRPRRDYWRVELASGARLWVCRVPRPGDGAEGGGRWFLHGFFA